MLWGLSFLLMGVSGELAFYETWDRTEPSDNPFDDVPPFPFSFDYEGNTIISGLNFVDAIIDLSQPPYYNHNLGSQFIEYQLFVKSGGSCEKVLYPVPMRSQWINNRLVKNEEFGPYVQKQPLPDGHISAKASIGGQALAKASSDFEIPSLDELEAKMDAEEFKQLKNNIYERETDFNFTTEGDGFALFKSNNVNHEHCRLHKKNEHYMATDVMKAHYGLHNVFLSHAEVLSQKCDAFLKISGEHFPKCMWKWYGHSELNCYNFPQYKDPVTITFAVNVGWKTTYGQQKSHSTSDTKHGSQTESEETNWGINGKLAPAAKGFSIWSLGAEYSKKNAYTNTTGWNKETTDSFLEMKGDETSGFYTVTRSITCHPGQHTQVLQKIFFCGDEQLRSGLFVNWDHSWTKETLVRPKTERVLLKDADFHPTEPTSSNPASDATDEPSVAASLGFSWLFYLIPLLFGA